MKICTVRAEMFQADRQTDRYNVASSRFLKFCERPWKLTFYPHDVLLTNTFIAVKIINLLALMMEAVGVFCEVRNENLCII